MLKDTGHRYDIHQSGNTSCLIAIIGQRIMHVHHGPHTLGCKYIYALWPQAPGCPITLSVTQRRSIAMTSRACAMLGLAHERLLILDHLPASCTLTAAQEFSS